MRVGKLLRGNEQMSVLKRQFGSIVGHEAGSELLESRGEKKVALARMERGGHTDLSRTVFRR